MSRFANASLDVTKSRCNESQSNKMFAPCLCKTGFLVCWVCMEMSLPVCVSHCPCSEFSLSCSDVWPSSTSPSDSSKIQSPSIVWRKILSASSCPLIPAVWTWLKKWSSKSCCSIQNRGTKIKISEILLNQSYDSQIEETIWGKSLVAIKCGSYNSHGVTKM